MPTTIQSPDEQTTVFTDFFFIGAIIYAGHKGSKGLPCQFHPIQSNMGTVFTVQSSISEKSRLWRRQIVEELSPRVVMQ